MFNLSKTLVFILSTSALSLIAVNAFAEDGHITLMGKVLDETCTLTGGENTNGKGKEIIVSLDTVRSTVFSTDRKVAGNKSFQLQLTDSAGTGMCDAVTNSNFKGIHITTASSSDYLEGNAAALINKSSTVSAQNPVYIQLLNDAGKEVSYTEAWGTQASSAITEKDGKPTLTYQAQYFSASGQVDGQEVEAVVNYTLQYN